MSYLSWCLARLSRLVKSTNNLSARVTWVFCKVPLSHGYLQTNPGMGVEIPSLDFSMAALMQMPVSLVVSGFVSYGQGSKTWGDGPQPIFSPFLGSAWTMTSTGTGESTQNCCKPGSPLSLGQESQLGTQSSPSFSQTVSCPGRGSPWLLRTSEAGSLSPKL